MDEAHKTVGRKDKMFAHLLNEKNIKIKKRLFMTATERQFIGSSDEIASMDDPDVYGETFELLTFKEAIEAKDPIICDYRFVTIGISEQEIRDLWNDNKYLRISSDQLDEVATRSLAAGLALRKAYTKFKVKRAISFHGSIRKAENFMRQQEAITEVFPELAKVECHHVSSKVPTSKRATILRDFAASKRGLITNARCLTEGVDIPSVDCVLFADPRRSTVDIVQAAGRAMRKAEGKKFGYIIVPMIVPDDVDIDEFAEGTEFKEVVRTIRPLAVNDDRIVEYFRAVSEGKKPKGGGPIVIDGAVKLPQTIDEKSFVDAIQLRVWDRVAKISWRRFEEARKYVQSLNLKKGSEWVAFTKSGNFPADIPVAPNSIYKNIGWVSMGDWLGTGTVASQFIKYRPFKDARKFARNLNLKNANEWRIFTKSGKLPEDIPAIPYNTYRDKGWVSFGDWLGTGVIAPRLRKFRTFIQARKFAQSLNLKSATEWREFTKSGKLPADIPVNPDQTYTERGWDGYGDWLGTGTVAAGLKKYRPFKQARAFARNLNLKNNTEWRTFAKSGDLPLDIPAAPDQTYKDKGWAGFGDWLGTGNVRRGSIKYRPFRQARAFVRSLKFKNSTEWLAFTKSDEFPTDIPVAADVVYKDSGWKNMGDWLGTGFIPPRLRKYRPYNQARKFAHSLKLKSSTEWSAFTKSGKLPADIPVNPSKTYKDMGWVSFGDWLGTGYVANRGRSYRSFEDARKYARGLGFKTGKEWQEFAQNCGLPEDIPAAPQNVYRDDGWQGVGDWLGSGYVANSKRSYRSFQQARAYVHTLGLKRPKDWFSFSSSGKRPQDIPSNPSRYYQQDGWISWPDWLGYG